MNPLQSGNTFTSLPANLIIQMCIDKRIYDYLCYVIQNINCYQCKIVHLHLLVPSEAIVGMIEREIIKNIILRRLYRRLRLKSR